MGLFVREGPDERIEMTGTKGKVVAITGASSGIGEATARLPAEGGAGVVLGARRTERLDAIARVIRDGGGAGDFGAEPMPSLGQQNRVGHGCEIISECGIVLLTPDLGHCVNHRECGVHQHPGRRLIDRRPRSTQ